MTELEKFICNKLGVKYGVYTGNGTTAMYLTFMALGMQNRKVIFPAISCTNPVNAAYFAGYTVDFCDVSIDDYTIDVEQLETMLKTGEYGIVIPTHIYGHRYNESVVRELCNRYKVVLIEDAAQSYYVGNMDVSIMSFGHTKICDTELGGGIALTNDFDLINKIRREKERISTVQESYDQMLQHYRKRYYDIVKSICEWEKRNEKIKELQLTNKDYFIFDGNDNNEIFDKLEILDKLVYDRKNKTKLYDEFLSDKYVIKPNLASDYRWRYTFLYRGNRDRLLEEARTRNIDISSWYYSLAGVYKGQHLHNADIVEQKVVNLWVDETHSKERIMKDINILNDIMKKEAEET